jgi:hypothetical protein
MTGYTKGPWVADKFGDIDGPNGEPIATTDGVPGIEDVAGANARLIAAAPDMYEALRVAEIASEELCQGQDAANECWNTLRTIRAAIAKAEGK